LRMMTSFENSNNAMADTIIKRSNIRIAMTEQQWKDMEFRMD
jgi:hypothetical protein